MRRFITVTVLVLALAGCSAEAPERSAAELAQASQEEAAYMATAMAPVSSITDYPHPDAAQEAELIKQITALEPKLPDEKIEGWARSTCMSMWAGDNTTTLIASAQKRFTAGDAIVLDRDEAAKLLGIVKTVFCHE